MNEPRISLHPITAANREECVTLRVARGQEGMVASNFHSLAEAGIHKSRIPLALYQGRVMVGFTMYGMDEDDGNWWIYRLMVDRRHQRRGYGRAAMRLVIRRIRAKGGKRPIMIGYKPCNRAAASLYALLGFRPTGKRIGAEVVAALIPGGNRGR